MCIHVLQLYQGLLQGVLLYKLNSFKELALRNLRNWFKVLLSYKLLLDIQWCD